MLRLYVSSSLQKKNLFRSFFSETEICFDSDQSRFFFPTDPNPIRCFCKNHLSDYFLHRRKWAVIKKKTDDRKKFQKEPIFPFFAEKRSVTEPKGVSMMTSRKQSCKCIFCQIKNSFFFVFPSSVTATDIMMRNMPICSTLCGSLQSPSWVWDTGISCLTLTVAGA